MSLAAYLSRIGYNGPRAPQLDVLKAVHRAHALNIAYENLDVLSQRPVDQNIDNILQKLVANGRGGWCYEMNGLLGWALTELGFNVTRMSGGVMRAERGDEALGNHLLLRVDLDEPWLADVGLGDGLLEPIPLRHGTLQQGSNTYTLMRLDDGSWRFLNRHGGMPPSFDFYDEPAAEDQLARTCKNLQQDSESMFRQNLVAQRRTPDGVHLLLGKVYTNPEGKRRLLSNEAELSALLETEFGIHKPPVQGVWPAVEARHQALFGDTDVNAIRFGPPADE